MKLISALSFRWSDKVDLRPSKLSNMAEKCCKRCIEALRHEVFRGSVTNKSQEGAAVLERVTQQHYLVEQLAPLEEPLLQQIVRDTAEAFRKAQAVPLPEAVDDDVQKLYVSVLMALHAARPIGSLQPHNTHARGLSGIYHHKADIVVTDCDSALAPHIVD